MSDDTAALILALAVENAELRTQLAEAQDLLVETAVDAGDLHARLEELQADLVEARVERDAWRDEAERGRKTGWDWLSWVGNGPWSFCWEQTFCRRPNLAARNLFRHMQNAVVNAAMAMHAHYRSPNIPR